MNASDSSSRTYWSFYTSSHIYNQITSPLTLWASSSTYNNPILHLGCLRRSFALPGLKSSNPSLSSFQGIWLCPNTTTRALGNSCRATFPRLCASPRICTMPIRQWPTTISRLIGNFNITSSSSTLPCTATTGAMVSNSASTERTVRPGSYVRIFYSFRFRCPFCN